jgi:hypothetical protein
MLFVLAWRDCESSRDRIFIGPPGATADDFAALCDRQAVKAAEAALSKGEASTILWSDLVDAVATVMPEHGYAEIQPARKVYREANNWFCVGGVGQDDPNGVLPPELVARLRQHNDSVWKSRC